MPGSAGGGVSGSVGGGSHSSGSSFSGGSHNSGFSSHSGSFYNTNMHNSSTYYGNNGNRSSVRMLPLIIIVSILISGFVPIMLITSLTNKQNNDMNQFFSPDEAYTSSEKTFLPKHTPVANDIDIDSETIFYDESNYYTPSQDDIDKLNEGAVTFYKKTGILPCVLFLSNMNGNATPTVSEAREFLQDRYFSLFYDETRLLVAFITDENGSSSLYLYAGIDTDSVLDRAALYTIKNETERYLDSDFTPAQAFYQAFLYSGDAIMSEQVSSLLVRKPLAVFYCDEYDLWFESNFMLFNEQQKQTITAGLSEFFCLTGVQPYLIIDKMEEGYDYNDQDFINDMLTEKYIDLFGDDEGHYIVFYAQDSDNNYVLWYIPGLFAEEVVDSDASDLLLDTISDTISSITLQNSASDEFANAFSSAFAVAAGEFMTEEDNEIVVFPDDDYNYSDDSIFENIGDVIAPIFSLLFIFAFTIAIVVVLFKVIRAPSNTKNGRGTYNGGNVSSAEREYKTGSTNPFGNTHKEGTYKGGFYTPRSADYTKAAEKQQLDDDSVNNDSSYEEYKKQTKNTRKSQKNPYTSERDYSDSLPVTCPQCRATGILTADGCCRYCGKKIK